jgi:hypothetical protein
MLAASLRFKLHREAQIQFGPGLLWHCMALLLVVLYFRQGPLSVPGSFPLILQEILALSIGRSDAEWCEATHESGSAGSQFHSDSKGREIGAPDLATGYR